MIGRADLDRQDRFVPLVARPTLRPKRISARVTHHQLLPHGRRSWFDTGRRSRHDAETVQAGCHHDIFRVFKRLRPSLRLGAHRKLRAAVNNSASRGVIRLVSTTAPHGRTGTEPYFDAGGMPRLATTSDREFRETAMARHTAWVLALAITCAPALIAAERKGEQNRAEKPQSANQDRQGQAANARAAPDDRERRKWWLYDNAPNWASPTSSRSEINQIFEATISKLRDARKEMDRAEEELSRAIKEHKADSRTISRTGRPRRERALENSTRLATLMLYRMHLRPQRRSASEAGSLARAPSGAKQ